MNRISTLLRNAKASPRIYIVPLSWAAVASFFDGISIGMFVPIFKGLVDGNFEFVADVPGVSFIGDYLPVLDPTKGLVRPLVVLGGFLGLMFAAKLVTSYLAGVYSARAAYELSHKLRQESFARTITLGKAFFDSTSSGQLHTIITQFSGELSWRVAGILQQISFLLPLGFYVLLLFLLSWKAALVSICLTPIIFIIVPLYRRLARFSTQLAYDNRAVSNTMDRVLRGIVIVKANSGERAEIERFNQASLEVYTSGNTLAARMLFSHLLMKLVLLAALVICCGAFVFILKDEIGRNAATYIVYLLVVKRSIDVLQQGSQIYGDYKTLTGVIDSINELFSLPLEGYELVDGTVNFEGVQDKIVVKDLTFGYRNQAPVLHDVSFEINRGEVVALVGPSGSGKSTLAQLLLRLYDAEPGAITIDGLDIREYALTSLREKTAYVSQASNLFDDSLRNNLLYGINREVGDEELVEALKKARLESFYAALPQGLETRVGERGVRVSGGEAQRIAIARAILKDVDFFILDEATSALDATTEQHVQEALDVLIEDKTVIVIAHRFSTLKNVDRIIAIADGRLVEEGSLTELLEHNGLFAELWKAQELFV